MRTNLAIITDARMRARIKAVARELRALHKIALDPKAQNNLRRALTSTENARRIYEHGNLKPQHPMPQQQRRRERDRNPQGARYPAMK